MSQLVLPFEQRLAFRGALLSPSVRREEPPVSRRPGARLIGRLKTGRGFPQGAPASQPLKRPRRFYFWFRGSFDYQRLAWLATFMGRPKRSMKPRAAVTS